MAAGNTVCDPSLPPDLRDRPHIGELIPICMKLKLDSDNESLRGAP